MADSSEPAFLFLYRKGAAAPVDYLSTFATAPFPLSEVESSVTAYSPENSIHFFCCNEPWIVS